MSAPMEFGGPDEAFGEARMEQLRNVPALDIARLLVRAEFDLEELEARLFQAQRQNDVLERKLRFDDKTGVLTYSAFETSMRKRTGHIESEGDKGRKNVLAIVDLDNFKGINDILGYSLADECLRAVADTISGNIREEEDLVGRFGGEEFVIGLPGSTIDMALPVAKRIRRFTNAIKVTETLPLGVCIGLAEFEQGSDFQAAFDNANEALSVAKTYTNKNCIQSWPPKPEFASAG